MPNFLSTAFGVGNSIRTSGFDGLFSPQNFGGAATAGISTAFTNQNLNTGLGAALAPLGLGALGLAGSLGGGSGSKPVALHTEYAEEEATWGKPYAGGEDIVFYLLRADQTSGVTDSTNNFGGDQQLGQGPGFNGQANTLTTGDALGTNVGGVEAGRVPSSVQAGPNSLLSGVQSPFSQIATSSASQGILAKNSGAVGPLSNFDRNLSTSNESIGVAAVTSTRSLSGNAFAGAQRAVPGATYTANRTTSVSYFDQVSSGAFNGGARGPFEVPVSEFSTALSASSGGIDSSRFLKDADISGNSFFTTQASRASTAIDFESGIALGSQLFNGLSGGGAAGGANGIPSEWYFITAPQDISWTKNSNAKEVDTYGSNGSYLSYSNTGLRKLNLSDAMIEGFSNAKAVENNILALEACMKVVIDPQSGYASPYCWNVFAGNKSYGTFIITSINVQEEMRDTTGKATRARVDIEFMEVPSYQVSSGNDIATEGALAVPSAALENIKSQQAALQEARARSSRTGRTAADRASGAGGSNSGGGGGGGNGGNNSSGGGQLDSGGQPINTPQSTEEFLRS